MREQLLPYEGKLVLARGRKATIETNDDGTINVLLKAVEVRLFDPRVAMKKVRPIRVDHLWQRRIEPSNLSSPELLERTYGFGRVAWYERTGPGREMNGAVDLTVDATASLQLERVVRKYRKLDAQNATNGERADYLSSAVDFFDRGVPCWAWEEPTVDLERWIRREHANCARANEHECKAKMRSAFSTAKFPSRPCTGASPFLEVSAVEKLLNSGLADKSSPISL